MLQYFNTSWPEITDKMPELAEAGYTSLWLPPPTKGSGGLSVGYDLWDRFDLGSKNQRNTVSTRYGSESDLLRLVEVAHRFGIRVYFDNIMNHNAFDIPGFNADTPIDIYPGMVPEDFHLRKTTDGFYRKWDNTRNYNDAWQVQYLGLADLIDIAQEPGGTNNNFGSSEGSQFPKIKFVRHPNNPEYYCFLPNGTYVGFGPNNGITSAMLTDPANANTYSERVEDFLNRSARWLMDRTKADGLRLDAVKHVRPDFFGATFGADKDTNDYGYLGQIQRQYNLTRGYSDANHRDTLFDTEKPRDDAMLFGEHLGEPPGYGDYLNSGMRLVDNPLRQQFNDKLGNPSNGLNGFDQAGSGGFSPETGVMHAQSHDSDFAARPELQQAFYFTRAGLGLLYTDGNNQAETLGESGGAFPRHSNTNFLGQYGDVRTANVLYIHNQFARGYQLGRFSDADFVAYERIDKRENPTMTNADGVTMLFMLNDNFSNGQARSFATSFPATAFTAANAYLYNYSSYGGGFYKYASELGTAVVPPGGYFAFSWKNPDPSNLWAGGGGKPITILQNGQPVGSMSYVRKDGRDGDKGFNPYNLPDQNKTDLSYTFTVPRVTNGTNLSFIARTDGSAENILMKLDGGVNINSQIPLGPTTGDKRDNRPALSTDTFLGYEQMQFNHRQHAEKFAAINTVRCTFGSAGAETYTGGGATVNGGGTNPQDADAATFVFHDPNAGFSGWSGTTDTKQYNVSGSTVTVWAKTNSVGGGYRMFIYYTTDGTNPEGAGGVGNGSTTVESFYFSPNTSQGDNWWRGQITPVPTGTLRYKIGIYKDDSPGAVPSIFPTGATEVARKKNMMTMYKIPGFNATTVEYYPHNDYGSKTVGLKEGFHFLQARAFLSRAGRASIYNTFTQTFYYDAETPQGEIKFPANDGSTLTGQTYGIVVRGDQSVKDAWMHIDDTDSTNDDVTTRVANGNGTGFEPFTDANSNGTWDTGETFTDLNGNAQWNDNVPAWIKISEVTPNAAVTSIHPREWRADYRNIAASGTGSIKVRLREISSSDQLFQVGNSDITDATGHFTTLIRTFTAAGDPQRMFIAFPSTDGQAVGENYVMKTRFSEALGDNVSDVTLKSRFVVKIASSESGASTGLVTQSADSFQIIRNSATNSHDLAFTLPNLYNGVPDFVHTIQVTLTRPNNSSLVTTRQVKAAPTAQGSFVTIKNPPEFDSDGKRFEIVLPDIAAPTPAQRQSTIAIETSTDIETVNIAFANNTGTATLASSTETLLKGFVNVTNGSPTVTGTEQILTGNLATTTGSATVTGTGTAFTTELSVGDIIRVGTNSLTVLNISSPTSLTTTENAVSAATGSGFVQPQLNQSLSTGNLIRIGSTTYTVTQVNSASSLTLSTNFTGSTATGLAAYRVDGNPTISGAKKNWTFNWTNMTAGFFTFTATAHPATGSDVVATRNATVLFRQVVPSNELDADDDEDGLGDINETTTTALPTTNAETWKSAEVHVYYAYGHTSPISPDSDGDGLPDGLEVGWRTASNPPTDIAADTNGDGFKNFIGDLDPPFYNTLGADYPGENPNSNLGRVPNVNDASQGGDRAALRGGSTTDPNNADSDNDGIDDGIEDTNRNGWVNGDGEELPTNFLPFLGRKWPNGKMDPTETWIETDPNIADSDVDGLLDGFGEDKNGNGLIDGDTNKNRAYNSGELWSETNPLSSDTDGDGLPDGWEVNNGLDPLDNGTLSLRTGGAGDPKNGASGNPDGDTILENGQEIPYTNIRELTNGTDPQTPTTIAPPPPGSIVIGAQSPITVGAVSNIREFTDWSANDLIVLDEYDGDGANNQGGDIFHANDGFDSSRDLMAFYTHDGGDLAAGGDGNFYFRVDIANLAANAESGNLDIYVAVDTGNPAVGEYALPDDVDTGTQMRWEAVVACYSTNNGRIYIDTNAASNSTAIGQTLSTFGVISRNQTATNGFKRAYYNSELDAVEFSISRQALRDAGWNGDPTVLNYQVFTTKDSTGNSPVGAGDLGGRSDIRDTIYDDFLASDYFKDQSNLAGDKSVLTAWFSSRPDQPAGRGSNDRGKRAKIALLAHTNQAIVPGSQIQAKINNGAGAGYYRPLDVHQAYASPLNLHLTPTTASAIEWAAVDPVANKPFLDGPTFNNRIENQMDSSSIVLLGTTFSDHPLPYFTNSFTADNVALSNDFLSHIYGSAPSAKVFYAPERVLDGGTFSKITSLGYTHTLVDQMRHILKWYGRNSALGNDGYRINEINGVKTFVVNDDASAFRFNNTDNGLSTSLRELTSRKARSGQQDQIVILANILDDFTIKTNADAYDKNIRWLASRPWIQIVSLDAIANGSFDISTPPDGINDTWGHVSRATNLNLVSVAPDFLDHATQESYDNWYFGQTGLEESLSAKVFNIRAGSPLPQAFGQLGSSGLLTSTWNAVQTISPLSDLQSLARITTHAAMFVTAFHDQTNNDLSKFSTGAYINPDTSSQLLAGFSKNAQSQVRLAAIYQRVEMWRNTANSGTYLNSSIAETGDVDLDGEAEYLLFNDRVFALFERIGGRLIGAWVRDIDSGKVFQTLGNPMSYSGSETEDEGTSNTSVNAVGAYRTSGLKDWFATPAGSNYVNNLYTASTPASGTGWKLTSSDSKISKTITLAPRQSLFQVSYTVAPEFSNLYIRFGLSPNLEDLLLNGQANLSNVISNAQELNLFNNLPGQIVRAFIRTGGGSYSGAVYNAAAVDDNPGTGITFSTLNMRNQAQTHQIELNGSSPSLSFALGFETGATVSYDSDNDGLPNWWETANGLDANDNTGDNGNGGNPDNDGKTNIQEFILQTDPKKFDYGYPAVSVNSGNVSFPTLLGRNYQVQYRDDLTTGIWQNVGTSVIGTGGMIVVPDNNSSLAKRFYRLTIQLSP